MDLLPEIQQLPRVVPDPEQLIPEPLRQQVDAFLRTRAPANLPQDLAKRCLAPPANGYNADGTPRPPTPGGAGAPPAAGSTPVNPNAPSAYNVPLMNALVLYVGSQAKAVSSPLHPGAQVRSSTGSHRNAHRIPPVVRASHGAWAGEGPPLYDLGIRFWNCNGVLDRVTDRDCLFTPRLELLTLVFPFLQELYVRLAGELDSEGRYLLLNAMANQLRYPNAHTYYFSCTLLTLFMETKSEGLKEQITRTLLERLIVNRPHPWGLLITFIELIKNRCAPVDHHNVVSRVLCCDIATGRHAVTLASEVQRVMRPLFLPLTGTILHGFCLAGATTSGRTASPSVPPRSRRSSPLSRAAAWAPTGSRRRRRWRRRTPRTHSRWLCAHEAGRAQEQQRPRNCVG